jgi:drug/metabolite transporter (DMT)-like permease
VQRSGRSAVLFAVLAGIMWAPHFRGIEGLRAGAAPVPALVAQFYVLFWAAAGLILLLFLSGRLAELSVFNRRETSFLILAALGGYAFWMLRAVALEATVPGVGTVPSVQLLFYTAPLLIGLFSTFGREHADGRTFLGLLLGLGGCFMLSRGAGGPAGTWSGMLPALGAAACWALFSLAARPIARDEKALPVAAIVLSIGAVCLFVTCVARGDGIFHIGLRQLASTVPLGIFTVGLMLVFWLKCLGSVPAAVAAPLWYLGFLFGVLGPAIAFGGMRAGLWWLLGGSILILAGIQRALSGRSSGQMTLSDVIRGH